jgi:hypothetical protein
MVTNLTTSCAATPPMNEATEWSSAAPHRHISWMQSSSTGAPILNPSNTAVTQSFNFGMSSSTCYRHHHAPRFVTRCQNARLRINIIQRTHHTHISTTHLLVKMTWVVPMRRVELVCGPQQYQPSRFRVGLCKHLLELPRLLFRERCVVLWSREYKAERRIVWQPM